MSLDEASNECKVFIKDTKAKWLQEQQSSALEIINVLFDFPGICQ
jgi:hypothetical protein